MSVTDEKCPKCGKLAIYYGFGRDWWMCLDSECDWRGNRVTLDFACKQNNQLAALEAKYAALLERLTVLADRWRSCAFACAMSLLEDDTLSKTEDALDAAEAAK